MLLSLRNRDVEPNELVNTTQFRPQLSNQLNATPLPPSPGSRRHDEDIMAAGGWAHKQMLDYYDMTHQALKGKATNTLTDYLG